MGVLGSVRTVSVELSAKIAGYVTNLKQAGQATKAFSAELVALNETSKEKFNQVTKAGLIAGSALAALAVASVAAAYKFDQQMSAVAAVATKEVPDAMGKLRAAAIQAGKDTVYSATEAAKAEEELAKAGVSTTDILGGALRGALALAAAGQIDLGDAAKYAAEAENIFGLRGKDVTHIADVLTNAANNSATDVGRMGQSLEQAGLVAHQTGLSFEQTAGALALFAQNGLIGSDAGTSFKVMLQALQAPSKITAALMEKLGINAYNTRGAFIGIVPLAQQLQDKLGGLTQAERDNALAQIFGNDGVRAANVLYKEGGPGLQKWIDGVNKSGTAAETARQKLDNLHGDVEQLRGSLETLAIQSSGGVTQGLRFLTEATTGFVNALIKLPAPLTATLTVLTGVAGGGLLAATAFIKVNATLSELSKTISGMGTAGEKFVGFVGSLSKSAGVWGLAAAGVAAFVIGVTDLLVQDAPKFKPVARDVDALTASLRELAITGKVVGNLATTFGSDLSTLATEVKSISLPKFVNPDKNSFDKQFYADAYNEALNNLQVQGTADIGKINDALIGLLNNGNASIANLAFDDVTKQLKAMGVSGLQLNDMFSRFSDEQHKAALGTTALAQGLATSSQQAQIMSQSLSVAIARGETMTSVFKELNGAATNSKETAIDFEQSLDDLTATLAKSTKENLRNGKALNINTQAGRDNEKAILDTIDKAEKAAAAKYDETQSVEAATSTYDDYINRLKITLHNAGLTDKQINDLIGTYAKMPPAVVTLVTAKGLEITLQHVKDLIVETDRLNGKVVNVQIHYKQSGPPVGGGTTASANRWGGVYTHAATGLLNASVFSPTGPALYAFAEPQTGGEGFVPRIGDYTRSTRIIDEEARWYGGRFVPNVGAGWGGGGSTYAPSTSITVNARTADFSPMELVALQARVDAMHRVGRPQ